MNINQFVREIEKIRQRANSLKSRFSDTPQQQTKLFSETFEQLNTSLEELCVTEEELREQNEQLIKSQHDLNKERQRYQELFDFAPDGYLVTDINGKILEANQTVTELLAIEKVKLVGKLIISFVPQQARREFRHQLRRLSEQTRLKDWEIDLQNQHNILFNCEISVSSISDNKGNCIGMRWLLRDITARKLAEQKMRFVELQNLQLREAANVKSQILAVLSHELRTPLNIVIGLSDVLLWRNKNEFTPQSLTIIDKIRSNGKKLLTLIGNMLDFVKLEEGKLSIKGQGCNIKELVTITVEELSFFAQQKHISLDVNTNITNSKIVNDPIRIQQILTNLIFNAIKFTETGGVMVEIQEINEDKIIIKVKDTGIGISEIDLRHIFEAFRQANQTKIRYQQGTGLGLVIVKDLLELMGGNITVESKLGEGSTFSVEFPRIVN